LYSDFFDDPFFSWHHEVPSPDSILSLSPLGSLVPFSSPGTLSRPDSHRQQSNALIHWQPVMDISETDKEVEIHCEVPGMDQKDINIELVGNVLKISGEKSEYREETSPETENSDKVEDTDHNNDKKNDGKPDKKRPRKGQKDQAQPQQNKEQKGSHAEQRRGRKYRKVERSYGRFERTLQLPDSIDTEQEISARLQNGLLVVTIPKKISDESQNQKQPKRIEISSSK